MTKRPNRRELLQMAGGAAAAANTFPLTAAAQRKPVAGNGNSRLRAASLKFGITPEQEAPTSYTGRFTHAVVRKVAGPLKVTLTLLEDGDLRVCLVASDFNSLLRANISACVRRAIAADLKGRFP